MAFARSSLLLLAFARSSLLLLAFLPLAQSHGHLCKAVVKRAATTTAEACAVSWGCGGCQDGSDGLRFRRAISNQERNGLPECAPCGLVHPLGFPLDPLPEVAGAPERTCIAQGRIVECASAGLADHTTAVATHWDEPEAQLVNPLRIATVMVNAVAPACISNDAFGARQTAFVQPGDTIETKAYFGANHDGLYRYELSCGEQSTHASFQASPLTPWMIVADYTLPAGTTLPNRHVGYTRAETDNYQQTMVRCQDGMCGGFIDNAYLHTQLGGFGVAMGAYRQGTWQPPSQECETGVSRGACLSTVIVAVLAVPQRATPCSYDGIRRGLEAALGALGPPRCHRRCCV